jgi:hypothetical protein
VQTWFCSLGLDVFRMYTERERERENNNTAASVYNNLIWLRERENAAAVYAYPISGLCLFPPLKHHFGSNRIVTV